MYLVGRVVVHWATPKTVINAGTEATFEESIFEFPESGDSNHSSESDSDDVSIPLFFMVTQDSCPYYTHVHTHNNYADR